MTMNLDSQLVHAFKQAQATVMQYATLTYWVEQTIKDNEGSTRTGIVVSSPSGTFLCNPVEQSSKRIMETYGLTEPFEVAVTCDSVLAVGNGCIVGYKGAYYKVINEVVTVTHKLLVLKKWQLKEVPSVSA